MNYLFFPAKQGHGPRHGLAATLVTIDNKAFSADDGPREWANGPHKAKIAENTQTAGAGFGIAGER